MAGLPPFISFSTSYPEMNAAVLRYTDNERFVGKQQTENLGRTLGVAVSVRTATVVQTKSDTCGRNGSSNRHTAFSCSWVNVTPAAWLESRLSVEMILEGDELMSTNLGAIRVQEDFLTIPQGARSGDRRREITTSYHYSAAFQRKERIQTSRSNVALLRKARFPAKWITSELPVIRPELSARFLVVVSRRTETVIGLGQQSEVNRVVQRHL